MKKSQALVSHDQWLTTTLSKLDHLKSNEYRLRAFGNYIAQFLSVRGPLPTLFLDISYLIAKLGRLDNTKELVSQETISKNKNVNLYRYYFNTLNEDLLKKLVSYYNTDSSLFNYNFDLNRRAIGGWD